MPRQSKGAFALAALAGLAAASPAATRRDSSSTYSTGSTPAPGPYEATWESTDKHTASPEWFKDAKFGVYWHWGAFTTAQHGSEWYPRNIYRKIDAPETERPWHEKTYGDPDTVFGYDKFILGGQDLAGNHVQFKPVLVSEGGEFDPESWIATIKASGAKFAGPVAEHHDGYSLWDSEVNEWNSMRLGPKMDLLKMFSELVRGADMKLVIAMHQAFNTNGFFGSAQNQTDPAMRLLLGQLSHEEGSERWLAKQLEALEHVKPDMVWNDFSLWSPGWCQDDGSPICGIREAERLTFLAHYFNRGVEWGKEVLTTWKHGDFGFRDTSAVVDYERGGPAGLTRPYWQTDDAISASSWSYTDGIKYHSSKSMIHSLLDRVSKNGNMLLNISPTATGHLPEEQVQILGDIGAFLALNGEAVYETRAWDIYGEGPNRAGGGSFSGPLEGDGRDLRFTRSQDEKVLYATLLGWPEGGKTGIASLGSDRAVSLDGLTSVQFFGAAKGEYVDITDFTQSAAGLNITLPEKPAEEQYGYVLKLTFSERIPIPQPIDGATIWPAGEITSTTKGVSLEMGEFTGAFLSEAGLEGKDVAVIRVSKGSVAIVYETADFSGIPMRGFVAGEHHVELGSVGAIKLVPY
ncbi:alpha-L-fucosidase-domain-containing protein [Microdochium trichocladiopsis]|uniref:alpha-L-fucosidase n=1 Tax=Microdochium trichocladiopsis TaxID=1682393 RepID=A0A9P8Y9S4_9PEZI|nr:alpha-L-fucosidase-domain-containing protein [Microdochium trichocladiopsis]KAH7034523.1 alpha-L-fucosidase-domain-containing protein [Microdochium trichocladiopsis]